MGPVKYALQKLRYGAILLLCIPHLLSAQYFDAWPDKLSSDDSAAINALVLYPDDIRLSIFEACKYPEVIVRISALQKKSSENFKDLLSTYSQTEQENIWDITRYPALVNKIISGGEKSKNELREIATEYPAEMADKISEYGNHYFPVLEQINQIEINSLNALNEILEGYPLQTIQAFKDLANLPEVMILLNEHLQLSVLVGDMYRRNPAHLIHTADSINLIVARQNAENVEAWKNSISSDQDAQNDLKAATAEYAEENGYSESEYTTAPSEYYMQHYICYPYPYWFGSPSWYPYHYWYPYPWWYDWGFYYDTFGNIIIIDVPSYYFTYWYFYYPHHYYHHPHLANIFVGYYYGPRGVVDENTNVIHNWVDDHRQYLPEDFNTTHTNSIEVITQIGKLENDWQQQAGLNSANTTGRDEFMKKNKNNYPALSVPSGKELKKETDASFNKNVGNPPVKQPSVKINNSGQIDIPHPRTYPFEELNKGQQQHRNEWEKGQDRGQNIPSQQNNNPVKKKKLRK